MTYKCAGSFDERTLSDFPDDLLLRILIYLAAVLKRICKNRREACVKNFNAQIRLLSKGLRTLNGLHDFPLHRRVYSVKLVLNLYIESTNPPSISTFFKTAYSTSFYRYLNSPRQAVDSCNSSMMEGASPLLAGVTMFLREGAERRPQLLNFPHASHPLPPFPPRRRLSHVQYIRWPKVVPEFGFHKYTCCIQHIYI